MVGILMVVLVAVVFYILGGMTWEKVISKWFN